MLIVARVWFFFILEYFLRNYNFWLNDSVFMRPDDNKLSINVVEIAKLMRIIERLMYWMLQIRFN